MCHSIDILIGTWFLFVPHEHSIFAVSIPSTPYFFLINFLIEESILSLHLWMDVLRGKSSSLFHCCSTIQPFKLICLCGINKISLQSNAAVHNIVASPNLRANYYIVNSILLSLKKKAYCAMQIP